MLIVGLAIRGKKKKRRVKDITSERAKTKTDILDIQSDYRFKESVSK